MDDATSRRTAAISLGRIIASASSFIWTSCRNMLGNLNVGRVLPDGNPLTEHLQISLLVNIAVQKSTLTRT